MAVKATALITLTRVNDGATGPKGTDGKGIKSTSVTYQIWANGTSTPTGTWSSTPPKTTADKPYLWTKTVLTYTDGSTSPPSYSVGSTPEGIQIGGRNLIKGTTNNWIEVNTSQWYTNIIAQIKPIELYGLKVGDTVTFSFDINGGEHGAISRFTFYSDIKGTTDKIAYTGNLISKGTIGKSVVTHTITSKELYMELCIQNGETTYTSNVIKYKGPKLELGNKATDWTPAPEDQDQQVTDKINEVEKTIEEKYESALEVTKKDITGIVSEVKKQLEDGVATQIQDISNKFSITADGFASIQKTINILDSAINGTKEDPSTGTKAQPGLSEITRYISWDGDDLTLGTSSSNIKCKLSNSELGFYNGTDKVAWISNSELYILKALIATSIGCGNFKFEDEGDLGFSLI